jgi:hypothetical protein
MKKQKKLPWKIPELPVIAIYPMSLIHTTLTKESFGDSRGVVRGLCVGT